MSPRPGRISEIIDVDNRPAPNAADHGDAAFRRDLRSHPHDLRCPILDGDIAMKRFSKTSTSHLLQSIAVAVVLIAAWEGACRGIRYFAHRAAAPSSIVVRLFALFTSGMIWPHLWATLIEVLSGFVLGCVAGLVIGAMISLIPIFERLVYPYLVALQTLPKVAIAPLFIIWFGYGLTSKVVITALICFFPVLVAVIAGFHSTDKDQLDMMKAFGATKWQTLMRLRVPSALVFDICRAGDRRGARGDWRYRWRICRAPKWGLAIWS